MQQNLLNHLVSAAQTLFKGLSGPMFAEWFTNASQTAKQAKGVLASWIRDRKRALESYLESTRENLALLAAIGKRIANGHWLYGRIYDALCEGKDKDFKIYVDHWAERDLGRKLRENGNDGDSEYQKLRLLVWRYHDEIVAQERPMEWLRKKLKRYDETRHRREKRRRSFSFDDMKAVAESLSGYVPSPSIVDRFYDMANVLERIFSHDPDMHAYIVARLKGFKGSLDFAKHLGWSKQKHDRVYKRFYRNDEARALLIA